MKEWLYRAIRTFGQAMLGYLSANMIAALSGIDLNDRTVLKSTLLGLLTAAIAAGLAAVMNREKKEDSDET